MFISRQALPVQVHQHAGGDGRAGVARAAADGQHSPLDGGLADGERRIDAAGVVAIARDGDMRRAGVHIVCVCDGVILVGDELGSIQRHHGIRLDGCAGVIRVRDGDRRVLQGPGHDVEAQLDVARTVSGAGEQQLRLADVDVVVGPNGEVCALPERPAADGGGDLRQHRAAGVGHVLRNLDVRIPEGGGSDGELCRCRALTAADAGNGHGGGARVHVVFIGRGVIHTLGQLDIAYGHIEGRGLGAAGGSDGLDCDLRGGDAQLPDLEGAGQRAGAAADACGLHGGRARRGVVGEGQPIVQIRSQRHVAQQDAHLGHYGRGGVGLGAGHGHGRVEQAGLLDGKGAVSLPGVVARAPDDDVRAARRHVVCKLRSVIHARRQFIVTQQHQQPGFDGRAGIADSGSIRRPDARARQRPGLNDQTAGHKGDLAVGGDVRAVGVGHHGGAGERAGIGVRVGAAGRVAQPGQGRALGQALHGEAADGVGRAVVDRLIRFAGDGDGHGRDLIFNGRGPDRFGGGGDGHRGRARFHVVRVFECVVRVLLQRLAVQDHREFGRIGRAVVDPGFDRRPVQYAGGDGDGVVRHQHGDLGVRARDGAALVAGLPAQQDLVLRRVGLHGHLRAGQEGLARVGVRAGEGQGVPGLGAHIDLPIPAPQEAGPAVLAGEDRRVTFGQRVRAVGHAHQHRAVARRGVADTAAGQRTGDRDRAGIDGVPAVITGVVRHGDRAGNRCGRTGVVVDCTALIARYVRPHAAARERERAFVVDAAASTAAGAAIHSGHLVVRHRTAVDLDTAAAIIISLVVNAAAIAAIGDVPTDRSAVDDQGSFRTVVYSSAIVVPG